MKNTFLLLALALTTTPLFATGQPTPVKVDADNSVITWKGYKVLGNHVGTIAIKEGTLDFVDDVLTGGSFVIDMSTIAVTDLDAGKGKEKLEGHLNSDDFFGISSYPTAKLVITNVVSRGMPGDYKIIANLTIKETTNPVKFNATVLDGKGAATIKIDRTDYDVRYGSGSFFDNLGDNTIYDEFDLSINLVY